MVISGLETRLGVTVTPLQHDLNHHQWHFVMLFCSSELKKENDLIVTHYLGDEQQLPEHLLKELSVKNETCTPWWWGFKTLVKYRTAKNYQDPAFLGPRIGDKVLISLLVSDERVQGGCAELAVAGLLLVGMDGGLLEENGAVNQHAWQCKAANHPAADVRERFHSLRPLQLVHACTRESRTYQGMLIVQRNLSQILKCRRCVSCSSDVGL